MHDLGHLESQELIDHVRRDRADVLLRDRLVSEAALAQIGEVTRVEREVLASLISIPRIVVATGGGTYVAEENRNLVEAAGWSVWLRVGLGEALRRCEGGAGRPLWGGRPEIEELYRFRQEFYRCARVHVDTESGPPAEVAQKILESLKKQGFSPR